jgi:hypothetical protein
MSINLVQQFIVEVDSIELLRKYLELSLSTVLNSTEEIAVKVIDHNDKCKRLYYPSAIYSEKDILPVLLIGGWYKSKDKSERSYFGGYKPWTLFDSNNILKDSIDHIITTLNDNMDNLTKKFLKECGDGYNTYFNNYDGSVRVGYRLMSNNTFPNSLSLSLVHIYYGK